MLPGPRSVVSFTAGGFYYAALCAREKVYTPRGGQKDSRNYSIPFLPNERYKILLTRVSYVIPFHQSYVTEIELFAIHFVLYCWEKRIEMWRYLAGQDDRYIS